MLKGETVLSGAPHPGTELQILVNGAGVFYLGFLTKEGEPYSRESIYFPEELDAVLAFNNIRK